MFHLGISQRFAAHYHSASPRGIHFAPSCHWAWVSIGLLVACGGCSCSPPPPPAGLPPSTAEAWLRLIEEEKMDEAAELLIQNPGMLDALNAPEAFTLSEDDFAWLSYSRREEVMNEAIEAVKRIKPLSRAMLEKAAQFEQDGKPEEAQRYREAVQNLGQSLNSTERLLILQQLGSALQSLAQQPPQAKAEEASAP